MLALLAATALAHTPNIATFELQPGADGWVLEAHLPTAGLQTALDAHAVQPGAARSTEAWATEAEALLRGGIALHLDGRPVALGEARVALGPHQSDIVFTLVDPPETVTDLAGTVITAMREVPHQQNVLRLLGPTPQRWVLNDRDAYLVR